MALLKSIDNFLNSITMYRLLFFGLGSLTGLAVVLSVLGFLSFTAISLLASAGILLFVCRFANWIFAKLFHLPDNPESGLITGLILFFLLPPPNGIKDAAIIAGVGIVAIASKHLLSFHKRHIFNPAAFGAFILGVSGLGAATWWIGSKIMLVPVIILALMLARKVRKVAIFFGTVAASVVVVIVLGLMHNSSLTGILAQHFLSWPIVFFASIMVTEPQTLPPRKHQQLIYGAFIGALSSWPFSVGPIFNTPEFSLLLGNIYSWLVSVKRRLTLKFIEKKEIAKDTYEFVFSGLKPKFLAGQYFEWTLPHQNPDSRGIRRYFTIASSPTEDNIKLGVKFYPNPSTFKSRLINLNANDEIWASQLGGDFVLRGTSLSLRARLGERSNPDVAFTGLFRRSQSVAPRNDNSLSTPKLVFIAGGIGITPFRSMIKYLIDNNEKRNIILFYCNKTWDDVAYLDLLNEAKEKLNLELVHVITEPPPLVPPPLGEGQGRGSAAPAASTSKLRAVDTTNTIEHGFINEAMLKKYAPDFLERFFYLSGPPAMVDSYKHLLLKLKIQRKQIKTDYFPGY